MPICRYKCPVCGREEIVMKAFNRPHKCADCRVEMKQVFKRGTNGDS